MSELKVHRFITTDELFPEANAGALYYLKSEVDKVIAEKDKKIDLYKRGWEESDRINASIYAELRQQKYKRCLAMAEKCESMCYWFAARFDHHELVDNVKWELFDRWRLRWAKLADKFKEAK